MPGRLLLALRIGFVVALVAGYLVLVNSPALMALADAYWFIAVPLIGGPLAFVAAKLFPGLEDSGSWASSIHSDPHD